MPAGISTTKNSKKALCLLEAVTANNVIPTLANQGYPVYPSQGAASDDGHGFVMRAPLESTLLLHGTATAAEILTVTATLWGYLEVANTWYEIPLNGGTAITAAALAETDSDRITFTQRLQNLGHFDRVYLQLTGIGGAGASITAYLVTAVSGTAA